MKILCASKQLLGQREKQEDYVQYLTPSSKNLGENQALLLLADGMGGYAGGEKASHLVVEKFADIYQQQRGTIVEILKQGLDEANDALAAAVLAEPEYKGMGCTLIAVHIKGMQLHWLSVGDSPFWLYRDHKLMRLNQDHSMAAVYKRMVEMEQMSEEDAQNEPMRNSLRSVVKGEEIAIVDAPDSHFALQSGDILLLASDGLETLSPAQITTVLKRHHGNNMETLAEDLLTAVGAEKSPIQDNVSVITYKVPESKTHSINNSSEPWYTNTAALLIITAFSLSALIVMLILQFKPDIFGNTPTKPPQVNTKPLNPIKTNPINNTQPEPKVVTQPDNPRVLQPPTHSGKPLDNPASNQNNGQSGTTADNVEDINTVKPQPENDNQTSLPTDEALINQDEVLQNDDVEEVPIGIENLDGFSESFPEIPDSGIEPQPALPPPPKLDNLEQPLIVKTSPLSDGNQARLPQNNTDETIAEPARTYQQ
ncbi:MAG: SpoIIE family protein phosphatase [Methylococcaceae bacterium]|nr:SpoIIE family protein phosphatase [Methylococcaceae bacterium]